MSLEPCESDAAPLPVVAGYATQVYHVEVAGRRLRILGPANPHALHDDPRIQGRHEADGYNAYWAEPWAGAAMLARFLLERTAPDGGPILELGAGLGIVGVALRVFGRRVVITDYDADALEFVRANAALNGAGVHDVRLVDWRTPPPEHYATIVGADVLYQREHHAPILALLAACLTPAGCAYFSDLNRSAADGFAEAARAGGFNCDVHAAQTPPIRPVGTIDGRTLHGRIFRISRSPSP